MTELPLWETFTTVFSGIVGWELGRLLHGPLKRMGILAVRRVANWQRPMITDTAWVVLVVVACVCSGLVGFVVGRL